jgi:hypothetical protein
VLAIRAEGGLAVAAADLAELAAAAGPRTGVVGLRGRLAERAAPVLELPAAGGGIAMDMLPH